MAIVATGWRAVFIVGENLRIEVEVPGYGFDYEQALEYVTAAVKEDGYEGAVFFLMTRVLRT